RAVAALARLSLPDALPISRLRLFRLFGGPGVRTLGRRSFVSVCFRWLGFRRNRFGSGSFSRLRFGGRLASCSRRRLSIPLRDDRSEEHTSELQSRENLVCR